MQNLAIGVHLGRAGTKEQRLGNDENLVRKETVLDFISGAEDAEAIDLAYSQSVPKEHRRRFAQFFTPKSSAALMAEWVTQNAPNELLDPALGTGILARAVNERVPGVRIIGYEIDSAIATAARKAAALSKLNLELRESDFFDSPVQQKYDSIIANPPYLRHHDLPNSAGRISQISAECGVRLSGLTNAYTLFLLSCCRRLKPGGRLAFIVPTEWTNSNFGKPIKEYLIENKLLRTIIYVCHSNTVFDDALTTACIVLVENADPSTGDVKTVFVSSDAEMPKLDEIISNTAHRPDLLIRDVPFGQLLAASKWDDLIRRGDTVVPEGFVPLRELATTKRGIATGANAFFHIPLVKAKEFGLEENRLIPCVGKATDVTRLTFTGKDFEELIQKGRPTHLINFTGILSAEESNYIEQGERDGIHQRYLTKKRSPWYSNERVSIAPIWASVFGRETMRFILNEAGVANLTAFHGIYPKSNNTLLERALVAALNSSVVQDVMKSEMRVYGGGLNKVEPRDLLDVKVPDLRHCSQETLEALSSFLGCDGKSHFTDVELTRLDKLVLRAGKEASEARQGPHPVDSQPSKASQDQLSLRLL